MITNLILLVFNFSRLKSLYGTEEKRKGHQAITCSEVIEISFLLPREFSKQRNLQTRNQRSGVKYRLFATVQCKGFAIVRDNYWKCVTCLNVVPSEEITRPLLELTDTHDQRPRHRTNEFPWKDVSQFTVSCQKLLCRETAGNPILLLCIFCASKSVK